MIGRLTGTIAEKGAEGVLLDVHGVGYELMCPLTVVDQLPVVGQPSTLVVHTHVREDQLTLFGFNDLEQRRLFRLLIGVSNVGPKIGLGCLSGLDKDSLHSAITTGDVKRLSSIPGIGKRTAERIILELRDKLGPAAGLPRGNASHLDDLQSALVNLGYRAKDVDGLLSEFGPAAAEKSFEELLREALKKLKPT
ncbi:MAG: Holliday junction branch migration protein RuvA [Myxococcota bacterium]|nr:Holliday junction branch migration protein RuvA [Myxococcota bacterium]